LKPALQLQVWEEQDIEDFLKVFEKVLA